MVTPHNVRAARSTALFAALQAAKGTAIADFTAGSAKRLWTAGALVDAGVKKSDPAGWMTAPQLPTGGRYTVPSLSKGSIEALATPDSLEWLVRASWGPILSGAFSLSSAVSEWLTLGWVEDVAAGPSAYFVRIWDAWVHQLVFRASLMEHLTVEAFYAGEQCDDPIPMNALGGIILPPAPMPPSDQNVFSGRDVHLIRDPDGENIEFALEEISVTIDQGLGEMFDQMTGIQTTWKTGNPGPRVLLEFTAHVSTETWATITQAGAGQKKRYLFFAQAWTPTAAFLIDMREVDFEVEPIGHAGLEYVRFRGRGQAHLDGSGNFVFIQLS